MLKHALVRPSRVMPTIGGKLYNFKNVYFI